MLKLPKFQALLQNKKSISRGFTLIELLVVIGILGVLAAALIATLDPFEQIKRGNDASTKSIASEYLNALQRYYTSRGAYPWDAAPGGNCIAAGGASPATGQAVRVDQLGGANSPCTTELATSGELKGGIAGNASLSKLYVSMDTTNNLVQVCYQPTSKSGVKDPNTKYTQNGGNPAAACPTSPVAAGAANACYYCLK